MVKNKAVYVVLGMNRSGEKEVLGLWIEQTEGAKFWLKVMNDQRNRGVADILIAVVDGLNGFSGLTKRSAAFRQLSPDFCRRRSYSRRPQSDIKTRLKQTAHGVAQHERFGRLAANPSRQPQQRPFANRAVQNGISSLLDR
jgi:hypothetical protein